MKIPYFLSPKSIGGGGGGKGGGLNFVILQRILNSFYRTIDKKKSKQASNW